MRANEALSSIAAVCLDGVQAEGGFGKDSGVGGSKHLLPAKHGEPRVGVEQLDSDGEGRLPPGVCGLVCGGCGRRCCFFAGVTMVVGALGHI